MSAVAMFKFLCLPYARIFSARLCGGVVAVFFFFDILAYMNLLVGHDSLINLSLLLGF